MTSSARPSIMSSASRRRSSKWSCARRSRVLYFAGYKKLQDRYRIADIEAASDEVVWCCDEAPGFTPSRAGDKAYVGNIVEAMAAHGSGSLGEPSVRLQDADRILAI